MKRNPVGRLLVFAAAVAVITAATAFCAALGAAEFRLTPDKSLEQIRDEVRAWRAADASRAEEPVTVVAAPGVWTLTGPVEFNASDSFTRYRAEKPGESIFTRGRKIENVTLDASGRFVAQIPTEGAWRFESLFAGGSRADIAREPDEFYFYIDKPVLGYFDAEGKAVDLGNGRAFTPRSGERELFERLASSNEPLENVKLKFFHSWETSLHRILKYQAVGDPESKAVVLTDGAPWRLDYWGSNLRYQVGNFAEALDTPGEWFLAADGKLTYIPLPGQTPENTPLVAPCAATEFKDAGLLIVHGDGKKIAAAVAEGKTPEKSLFIRDVTFEGIAFTLDEYRLPDGGLRCGQAAVSSPVSIQVAAADGVRFLDCEISRVGGYALSFLNACSDCSVERATMENLGAGGVKIGGNPVSTHVAVRDCVIRDYGHLDGGAIGVWLAGAQECDVTHNDISDGFYTGVSVGWVWGYGPSSTRHNRIEFNRIHHIGKGVLSDMGGVYSLGVSPGTRVANNVIHDVWSYNRSGRGGWGLYTDEGSSEILFENNLVYRVHTGAFHQHYGRDNIVRNNILGFSREGQIQRSRIEEHTSFIFENNIVVWDTPPLLASNWKDGHYVMKNNLYWFYGTPATDEEREGKWFGGMTLDQWQALGRDAGSAMADPGFTDAPNGDFTFKDGKINDAVKAIGFKPFDAAQAGCESDAMKRRAADYAYPPLRLAPDPETRPFALNETFETFRKTPLPGAVLSDEGVEGGAVVLEENGNHFLRLNDSDRYKASFNPHFYYLPRYKSGSFHASFDIRLSDDATVIFEGRTMSETYKVGPQLRFTPDGLAFRGGTAELPRGAWLRMTLDFPLGRDPAESGTVRVERLGSSEGESSLLIESPLAPGSAEFRSLGWFGFFTPGKVGTIDFDNLFLTNGD